MVNLSDPKMLSPLFIRSCYFIRDQYISSNSALVILKISNHILLSIAGSISCQAYHIQEFDLDLSFLGKYPDMPSHLFTFEQLSHLSLYHCGFKPPSAFKGFDRLVRLDFVRVRIVPDKFSCFISNCPLLEHLVLQECNNFQTLKIDAPNLKSFHFYGDFSSISFKNTPFLAEISMVLENIPLDMQVKECNLVKVFGHLLSLVRLRLRYYALQFLAVGGTGLPEKLANDLNCLKVIELFSIENLLEIRCSVCLIRSSPNLESFVIHTSETRGTGRSRPIRADAVEQRSILCFLKEQEKCKISLNQLKEVKIDDFFGLESEMEFVKLLLMAATTLQKLEIRFDYKTDAKRRSWILKDLTRFHRASPRAEIINLFWRQECWPNLFA